MFYLWVTILMSLSSNLPETWTTNYDKAILSASEKNQNILMVFSGSDWCAPCKKLKKDILTSEEFTNYEEKHLTILYLDFPSKKKNKLSKEQTQHNEDLAERYNKSGVFPKVLLLNQSGEIIKEIRYEGQSSGEFIQSIQ